MRKLGTWHRACGLLIVYAREQTVEMVTSTAVPVLFVKMPEELSISRFRATQQLDFGLSERRNVELVWKWNQSEHLVCVRKDRKVT